MEIGEIHRRTNIAATLHRSGLCVGVAKLNTLFSEDTWKHNWNVQKSTLRTLGLWETIFSGLMNQDWGTRQSRRKLNAPKYWDSLNENLVQSIQTSDRANRTMTLSTQQEWLIDNSVNVLEWPSHSLGLNPIKYFWRNLKMCICPIQLDRVWEVKRQEEEWQIIAKWWWSNKKTWDCKGASAKY